MHILHTNQLKDELDLGLGKLKSCKVSSQP
jgi:hypothetical protein